MALLLSRKLCISSKVDLSIWIRYFPYIILNEITLTERNIHINNKRSSKHNLLYQPKLHKSYLRNVHKWNISAFHFTYYWFVKSYRTIKYIDTKSICSAYAEFVYLRLFMLFVQPLCIKDCQYQGYSRAELRFLIHLPILKHNKW